jgi:hypothetical protein
MLKRIKDFFSWLSSFFGFKNEHNINMLCEWHIKARNKYTGEILYEETYYNVIVKTGREDMLKLLFNLTGQVPLVALGAGSGSTAADEADTRLETELIANATRKSLTKTDGSTPLIVETDEVTIMGTDYFKKVVCRGVFLSGDSNNGSNFREYGLFTTLTLPGTPTGTSGIMFNHFVAGADIPKDASTEIDVDTTVRF